MAAQEAAVQADLAHKAGVITVQQEQICALDDALQVKTPSKSSAMPVQCCHHEPAGTKLALSGCLSAAQSTQSTQ